DPNSHQMATRRVRQESQSGSAAIYTGKWVHIATSGSFGYSQRYFLQYSYSYPTADTDPNNAARLDPLFEYVFWPDSGDLDKDANTSEVTDRPMVIKTTRPTVTTTQNGPNVASSSFIYVNPNGQVAFTQGPDGVTNFQAYSDATGQLLYSVRDIYT